MCPGRPIGNGGLGGLDPPTSPLSGSGPSLYLGRLQCASVRSPTRTTSISGSCISRSGMTASPVLQLEARDTLEFALIVSDESEPCGFGVGCNPEIVAADHLTAFL
jgi:hypothetical protein